MCVLQDQFGLVRYRMIGDDSGPNFFEVNPDSGQVNLISSVEGDTLSEYRVSC